MPIRLVAFDTRDEVAAVRDSPRDAALFQAAAHSFHVGTDRLEGLDGLHHYPDGDLATIARTILHL